MGISYLKVGTRIRSAVCESQDLLNFGFNYGTLVYGVGSYGAIGLGIVTGPAPDRSFRPSPRLKFQAFAPVEHSSNARDRAKAITNNLHSFTKLSLPRKQEEFSVILNKDPQSQWTRITSFFFFMYKSNLEGYFLKFSQT